MTLKIVNPGLATSIQDLGRPGYFHLGIPMGGAMDRFALRCANMLVGNDEGAACLEAVFMGPQIEFTKDATVAVTGASLPTKVDGEVQEPWSSFVVKAGQTLSFDFLQAGARIYIAVSGGITTPAALGSRSTYPIGALGGVEGRAVQAGDELPTGGATGPGAGRTVPEALRRMPGSPAKLRVLPGLYWHRLTDAAGAGFFEDEWTVAPEADRMGYRFKGGRPLEFVEREQPFGAGADPSNIVDGCYSYGSIQVPGGTEPIVLHRDAVSGGGYFTLGAVISADMDLIGQLQPHTPVKFEKTDMAGALAARRSRKEMLEKIRQELV
ncbi:biotin-dependent carboxyltransferase family protein [Paracoccus sp. SCSIO 75233]|uniref:5-oxoprolinase subunit C family protein n=1 Tax=Paracoccus sp. SCSIO 75233 TaxID=3017782 RepID=UPI0022F02562|nr:biotin-dependent carboxyltransferase family protein [Paracoccus sp. SCSIO 75233]WBU52805.1 biotin-dependent carboxyltransferase family protein [Paracoccus sp. SCSIO 75233]